VTGARLAGAPAAVDLRPATADDALCLSVLAMQVFLDTYATGGIRPNLAREVLTTYSQAAFSQAVADPRARVVVAEHEGHLVGFAHVTLGAVHELAPTGPQAELLRLYVQEPFTRRRLGSRLLAEAERLAAAAGASVLWLTPWVHNHRALAFYARHGYADHGLTQFVFEGESHDNRVLAKPLSKPERADRAPAGAPLLIRALEPADAQGLRALMLEGHELAADAFTTTATERAAEPLGWWLRRIGGPGQLNQAFGAFDGGVLVGSVSVEYAAKAKTRHQALVVGMYVTPGHRGRGAGAALIRAVIEHARARPGVRQLTLTVTQGNEAAIRLYASVGFQAFGVEPMAIFNGDRYLGKVHMSLQLPQLADAGAPASGGTPDHAT
jgi:diamine N-acetyltransferase